MPVSGTATGAASVTPGATLYARAASGAAGAATVLGSALLVVPGQAAAIGAAQVSGTADLYAGPGLPGRTVGVIRLVPSSTILTLGAAAEAGTIRVRPATTGSISRRN